LNKVTKLEKPRLDDLCIPDVAFNNPSFTSFGTKFTPWPTEISIEKELQTCNPNFSYKTVLYEIQTTSNDGKLRKYLMDTLINPATVRSVVTNLTDCTSEQDTDNLMVLAAKLMLQIQSMSLDELKFNATIVAGELKEKAPTKLSSPKKSAVVPSNRSKRKIIETEEEENKPKSIDLTHEDLVTMDMITPSKYFNMEFSGVDNLIDNEVENDEYFK